MPLKLAQRKLERRQLWRRALCDVHVCGTSLVLACSLGVLMFCFVLVDIGSLYRKAAAQPAVVVLQKGLGGGSMASRGAQEDSARVRATPYTEVNVDEETINVTASSQFSPTASETQAHVAIPTNNLQTASSTGETHNGAGADGISRGTIAAEEVVDGVTTSASATGTKLGDIIMAAGGRQRQPLPLPECEISQGRWVYDESYPLYRTRNCPFADPGFRCEENGRPDTDFMKYRWQPHRCDLPRFNATDMLERLRGQRVVFVGDSLGRNNWESMLCMLAEGVPNKTRIYEVNGQPITKHVGELVFKFEDYNCTVEYYRDPFLVPQTRAPRDSPSNVTCALRVDQVSWSAAKWQHANIIIFNAGHWWTNEKIFRPGCRFQEGDTLKDYDIPTAFKVALRTWGAWIEQNTDPEVTQVFFRSFASVHFRGGAWNKGGHCHQEVRPLTEEEARSEWQEPWTNKVIEDEITRNIKPKRSSINYMDVTTATNYRSDGHGGLYTNDVKIFGPTPLNRQDCSHFCLPGVPDMWNELVFASLLASGQGAWGHPIRY